MKLVLSTAPHGYSYLFWLRNVELEPHTSHDVMDDSRADVFGEWVRHHANGGDPLENEPNTMTSSEDHANALDVEAAQKKKHNLLRQVSGDVFLSSC